MALHVHTYRYCPRCPRDPTLSGLQVSVQDVKPHLVIVTYVLLQDLVLEQ
jgi:hypothetical protein